MRRVRIRRHAAGPGSSPMVVWRAKSGAGDKGRVRYALTESRITMKRLIMILAGAVVAGGVAAAPAVAGLAGNPSFSHEIPVPVPSAAKTPLFADDGSRAAIAPASAAVAGSRSGHAEIEPGDRRGQATWPAEPGDDNGGRTPHAEPGDDNGGQTPHAEPGDDHGGRTPRAEPSDDHGHRRGRG